MKRITRENFEGLRQHYPVLNKEEMRRYVGGNFAQYDENYLPMLNPYAMDLNINACSAVGSEENDEMEEDTWSSDFGISAFSFGGYSYGGGYNGYTGYGYWDIDGGYLDEVVVYGNKPNNDYYYGGSGYPGWGDDSYWGGDSYWGYDWNYGYSYPDDGNKRGDIINEPWACMFNCMNYINPSKSASDYYKMYLESGGKDPKEAGGLLGDKRNEALKACGFSFEETITPGSGAGSHRYIGIINTKNKESHAVIIISTPNNNSVKVYDPSMPPEQRSYDVDTNFFSTMYKVAR